MPARAPVVLLNQGASHLLAGLAPVRMPEPCGRPVRRAAPALPAGAVPCQVRLAALRALRPTVRVLPLAAEPGAPATARHWLLAGLGEWQRRPEAMFVAELLVSELVTNAVRHACGPVRLRAVTREDGQGGGVLRVEVFDGDRELPDVRSVSVESESGRGLRLVDDLARCWGCRRTRHGKLIWFELDLDA
jgi:anti-sigma regulatory factor (Ser/Thr protein kinase)